MTAPLERLLEDAEPSHSLHRHLLEQAQATSLPARDVEESWQALQKAIAPLPVSHPPASGAAGGALSGSLSKLIVLAVGSGLVVAAGIAQIEAGGGAAERSTSVAPAFDPANGALSAATSPPGRAERDRDRSPSGSQLVPVPAVPEAEAKGGFAPPSSQPVPPAPIPRAVASPARGDEAASARDETKEGTANEANSGAASELATTRDARLDSPAADRARPPSATGAREAASGAPGAPPAALAPAASRLRAESALLDRARADLARGDYDAVLEAVRQARAEFSEGALAQEREVLAITALARSGKREAAARLGRRFLDAHPGSPHAARVEQLIHEKK